MNVRIPVLPRARGFAWPPSPDDTAPPMAADYMPIGNALSMDHSTDAHTQACSAPDTPYRLEKGAATETGGVPMVAFFADIDGPDHKADDAWWRSERAKIDRLLEKHPGGFVYRTRGGARLVYLLETPHIIRSDDDAATWTMRYHRSLLYLVRAFGIIGDPACSDWTRLYRLPHATRDPKRGPERLETIGNPHCIGSWSCHTDLQADKQTARELDAAFLRDHPDAKRSPWGPIVRRLDPPPVATAVSPGERYAGAGTSPRALVALECEREALAATPDGARNPACNVAAVKLGHLVCSGELAQGDAEAALLDAMHRNGSVKRYGIEAARKTIASGLKKGMADPPKVAPRINGKPKPEPVMDPGLAAHFDAPEIDEQPTPPKKVNGHAPATSPDQDPQWHERIVRGKEGAPQNGLGNVSLILANHPVFRGAVAHNEFTHFTEVVRPLPWDARSEFAPREWVDNDDIRTAAWLQLEYRFSTSTDMVAKSITSIAADCAYHPVREYLVQCAAKWDGTKRIDDLFTVYFGSAATPPADADKQDLQMVKDTNRYLSAVGRRFLIAAVARVMKPGCKVDTVPILDGKQGARKSTGLRILFDPWFTDELSTPGGKDADEQLRGVWVVEMAELEQFDKAESTRMKGFISRQVDRFRWSYGSRVVTFPRQNVFVGTTNVPDWGKDETGARRFWPVSVRGAIDVKGIRRDRGQLLGEAMVAFQAGEQWHLTRAEEELAQREQEARRQIDAIESPMADWLIGKNSASVPEILSSVLNLERSKWDQRIQNQVARVFRAWKWAPCRPRTPDGSRERRYMRPEAVKARVDTYPDQPPIPGPDPDQQSATGKGGYSSGPGGPGINDECVPYAHAPARTHARTRSSETTQKGGPPGPDAEVCESTSESRSGYGLGPGLSSEAYLDVLLPRGDS